MLNLEKARVELSQFTYEKALLCCALNNMDHFYSMMTKLNDTDFLHPDHAVIYNALKSLYLKDHRSFDIPIVARELEIGGNLQDIGGVRMLNAIKTMPVALGIFDKALIYVLEASTKFRLFQSLHEHSELVIENNVEGSLSASDLIGGVENSVLSLSTTSKAINEPRNLADGLREYIEEKKEHRVEMTGVRTHYPILDKQIDGMVPGTLMIIAARKKMGKSALLTNIAARIAYTEKLPLLYVDTEMSFEEWRDRLLAAMSSTEERIIKHGGYTKEEYERISKAADKIERGKLFHERMPGYTVEKLVTLYKKYKVKENIGFGIFDYIKEPESSSIDKQRQEHQILGDVTTKLKDLAGTLNIPMLAAVQLNRAGDVADSDRVARYGDIVAFWTTRTEDDISKTGGPENNTGGSHKLIIRDTRRGGSTPESGIAYKFHKKKLIINEVDLLQQVTDYSGKVVNNDSSDEDKEDIEYASINLE
jgi:replicative DNA helicase